MRHIIFLHQNPCCIQVALSSYVIIPTSSEKLLEGRLHEFDMPMMPSSKVTLSSGSIPSPVGIFVNVILLTTFFMTYAAGFLKLRFTLKFPLLSMRDAHMS